MKEGKTMELITISIGVGAIVLLFYYIVILLRGEK